MTSPLRVVLADDSYLVREGVRQLLLDGPEIDVVGDAASAPELRACVEKLRPAAILTDIRMPPHQGMDGIVTALAIRASLPDIGVVVLSQHADASYAEALFAQGTAGLGYLLKERVGDRDELVRALRTVADGGSVVDPTIVDVLLRLRRTARDSSIARLTTRENDVLRLVAAGHTNVAIAGHLHVSESAVSKHIAAIFGKLGLDNHPHVDRRVSAAVAYLTDLQPGR